MRPVRLFARPENFDAYNPTHRKILNDRLDMFLYAPLLLEQTPITGSSRVMRQLASIQNFQKPKELKDQPFIKTMKPTIDIQGAVQNFQTQHMASLTDYPEFLNDLLKKIDEMTIYDNEWEAFFVIRDVSGTSGYDVYTTGSNVVWENAPPGKTVTYYGAAGEKYRVYMHWKCGGIAVDNRLIIERDFFTIQDLFTQHRNAAFLLKAQTAYALIEAIPAGQNVAWQAPSPPLLPNTNEKYVISRDAQTLTYAGTKLIEDNKDKGILPNGANTVFKVLIPFQLTKRIQDALAYRIQNIGGAPLEVTYNFDVHRTTMLSSSTEYYVGIPGGKNTGGILLDITNFDEENKDNFTRERAGWMSYGFNIGDTGQWIRCSTS